MQIVPMRDLKNTVEIERRCAESGEPVFVTKNGYGRLVVMDIELYEKMVGKLNEAALINDGIIAYESGHVTDGHTAIKKIKEKHDL
ncbi:MAG: type II toxin-antitoxin system Phd/YefM family antitoxin [Lachnospiraceae bacterium]|nr:type II toxin-antitoxin system Phd/YefM family antitoxin [Lachnospiraceae bacterium]